MGRYGEIGWVRRFGVRDHELVDEAMDALAVEHLADRRFGDLSGGERQRALLAQAVAQDADLLLLDEPLTGIDAPTREAIGALLGRWRTEKRTVVVATHDLEAARRDYDLVACLNRRLVAFGPPAEIWSEKILSETFAGHVVRVGDAPLRHRAPSPRGRLSWTSSPSPSTPSSSAPALSPRRSSASCAASSAATWSFAAWR